jgi:uncharacterized membrane protein YidH (DUF202 family)
MGIGTGIFLFAVGAIMRFAVSVKTTGFNVHSIGVILMIVGVVTAILSMIFWQSWGGFHRGAVYEDGAPVRRRRVVREREVV